MKPVATPISLNISRGLPWWLWPNILSLDAPLVAVVVLAAFAQAMGVDLGWERPLLLALCAWLAYCGDRLLDARRLNGPVESGRHEFARINLRLLGCIWLVALTVAVVLAVQLPYGELLAGIGLAAAVSGYFLLQHHPELRGMAGRGKELMAGAGFAAGTLFFIVLNAPVTLPLVLLGVAWVVLCAMNCLLIAGWDRVQDMAMEQHSMAQHWPEMERAFPRLAMAPPALAGVTAVVDAEWLPLAIALAACAVALLELARRAPRMDPEARRVWADTVLLMPVLILF